MQSPAGQRSAACSRKKLSIGCLRSMQVFLSLFVAWVESQCFAELNHGLRGLALGQVHFAEVIMGNSQLGVPPKCRQIMSLRLLQVAFCKKRVGKEKLGGRVIGPEL